MLYPFRQFLLSFSVLLFHYCGSVSIIIIIICFFDVSFVSVIRQTVCIQMYVKDEESLRIQKALILKMINITYILIYMNVYAVPETKIFKPIDGT